jgi:hypothetical protein
MISRDYGGSILTFLNMGMLSIRKVNIFNRALAIAHYFLFPEGFHRLGLHFINYITKPAL